MAVFKSFELTNLETSPIVINPARDADARMRQMVYTVTNVTGLVATDTIRFGTLRKGWRLLGMKLVVPVNWLAATATLSLGVAGTVAKYAVGATDGIIGAAAVQLNMGHTAALGFGEVLAADIELLGTVNTAGAGSAPTSTCYLVVSYTRD